MREVGQLSWPQATAFLVGGKTGLVVDPWLLSRRPYVFDDTCRVDPSPTPGTLNPGFNLRRKNGVVRISQGAQVIDLAVPQKFVPQVELIRTSEPIDESAAAMAPVVSQERLARIARADLRAARRHAFFARINAQSKTNRWIAAGCSVFYLAPAVGLFIASANLCQYGGILTMLSFVCFAAAGIYAGRVILQEKHQSSSDGEQVE